MTALDWTREAACAVPPASALPWTADPGDASPAEVAAMARVCAGCPVRLACAAYAHSGVTAGFWAGRERGELDGARASSRRCAAA